MTNKYIAKYRKNNKLKLREYNKQYQKMYRKLHRERVNAIHKKYRDKNK